MSGNRKSLVTDARMSQLSATDSRLGLRPGTMYQVMMQESGGAYGTQEPHYPSGIAPNGKASSAFGPFGILASTGADPGFGVKPLNMLPNGTEDDRFAEQLRFAGDYLSKRGLAAYGEGDKYAQQVNARISGGKGGAVPVPTQLPQAIAVAPAQEQVLAPQVVAQASPQQPVALPAEVPQEVAVAQQVPADEPWSAFQQSMPSPVSPADLNFASQGRPAQPNFGKFGSFKGRV